MERLIGPKRVKATQEEHTNHNGIREEHNVNYHIHFCLYTVLSFLLKESMHDCAAMDQWTWGLSFAIWIFCFDVNPTSNGYNSVASI